MIERSLALLILRHIFPGDDRHVQYAATAGFSIQRRLLGAVPDPAVMYGEVAGAEIETDLPAIGIIVDEVLFAKKKPKDTLLVCTR